MKRIAIVFTLSLVVSLQLNAQTVVETVSSGTSGDATLKIEADTDNNNEADNPRIELKQDGGQTGAYIGFNADWGGVAPDNLFRIGTRYSGVDNFTRFIINPQNGNVGIGTTAPDEKLDVNGTIMSNYLRVNATTSTEGGEIKLDGPINSNDWRIDNLSGDFRLHHSGIEYFRLKSNGNIGVGTNSPSAKLEVKRSGNTLGGKWVPNNSYLTLDSGNGSILLLDPNEIYGSSALYFGSKSGDIAVFRTVSETSAASDKMIIKNNGNVGIGTTTPDAKLAVNGNIHTKEVKVDLIGWSDFVFEDSYKLPTLKEVEVHIKENGHLKDIPSAEEVKKDGIYLGEMDSKLLQKIEELTLYTIEQEKRIESLEVKNEKLIVLVEKLLKAKIEE